MKQYNESFVKLGLAVLLLLCLFNMPYGFYQLVRFLAMISFTYFSYKYFKEEKERIGFTYAALAVLFQPFLKITLGKTIWNIIDVVIAIGLICIVIVTYKNKDESP